MGITDIDQLNRNAQLAEQGQRDVVGGYAEEQDRFKAQQTFKDNVVDGFSQTFIKRAIDVVRDEAAPLKEELLKQGYGPASATVGSWGALLGYTAGKPDYDKYKYRKELTDGIPQEYWDDIMSYDNLEAAQRARGRVVNSLQTQQRMTMQDNATIAHIVGGMVDADLPIGLVSGGTLTGIKVGRAAYQIGRAAGLKSGTAIRGASAVATGLDVAATTALLETASMQLDPTLKPSEVAAAVAGAAVLGGAFGSVFTGSTRVSVDKMLEDYRQRIVTRPPEDIDTDVLARAHEDAFPEGTFSAPEGEAGSIGAAQVPSSHPQTQSPYREGAAPTPEQNIINASKDFLKRSGAGDVLADLKGTVFGGIQSGAWAAVSPDAGPIGKVIGLGKAAITRAVNVTGNDVMELGRSKSAVANSMFLKVFENPSGYGRGVVPSTAATLKAVYEARAASTMLRYKDVSQEWAKTNGNTLKLFGRDTGKLISEQGQRAFDREVYLNINDIRMGRSPRSNDPHILEAMGMVQGHGRVSRDILRGSDPRYSVKGTENLDYDDGYVPQRVNGQAIVKAIDEGQVTRQELQQGFQQGYEAAGLPPEVAEPVSKAVLARAIARDTDIDTGLLDMLNEDGRTFLRQRFEAMGMSSGEIENIMTKLTGIAEERGQEGFTKKRNDIDLDIIIPNTGLKLVDFMDMDMQGVLQRYRRGMSGSAALARKGIRSNKDLDDMLSAMKLEWEELGEAGIPRDKLDAMFSEFRSGPSHGYGLGMKNKGLSPAVTIARDASNLSLLHSLGFAQLAETGPQIAANGLSSWARTAKGVLGIDDMIKQEGRQVLDDLGFMMGEIGKDQHIYRPHLNLDEVNLKDEAAYMRGIRKGMGNMQYIQAYTSGFNIVRSKQQEMSALLTTNRVLREIKAGEHSQRLREDLGMDDQTWERIKDLIDAGTIEFHSINGVEYVNRLNPEQWGDQRLIDDFASIMTRSQSRLVQKALIGEQDTVYRTGVGAILGHLKSFPLTALPKQFMRNAKFADAEALTTVMYGLASAYVALSLRDLVSGRERSSSERAMAAVTYSNALGWMPMAVDPLATMVGLDDYRMNAFGQRYEVQLPVLDTVNNAMRLPSALLSVAGVKERTAEDRKALLALPFMRTLGIGNWIFPK